MKFKFSACLAILFAVSQSLFAQFSLQNLQVNYTTTPLGTDLETPQFSWQMNADGEVRNLEQLAYQLTVKNEAGVIVWDSEKVSSGLAHAIQYEGEALKPTTRYSWSVKVWGNNDTTAERTSWFETGLMNPSEQAWSGARWIGGGDEHLNFYSHYLSVFKLNFDVQLDEKSSSTKASFLFGANDSRLANQYLNLMAVQKDRNQSYIALELDISGLANGSPAQLNVYRVGYENGDKADVPFQMISVPENLINAGNKYERHTIYAECNFGVFEFYIDGQTAENKVEHASFKAEGPYGQPGLNLNPVGKGNNFISFPMLADIGLKTGEGQKAYFSNIEIKNFRFPGNTLFADAPEKGEALFSELKIKKGVYRVDEGTLVTANPSQNATPMLRTAFQTKTAKIKKARIYATARGIYDLYLNGEKVSEDYFNPGLTQYNKHHMYQTFDVTDRLKSGESNALGAWLSEGWWSGNITYSGESWNFFGDRQSLLAKMVITYEDGSEQVITSNDKNWKLFTDGPIRVGSFFQGEVYDASKEASIEGWASANYDDSGWKTAVEVPLKGTAYMGEFPSRGGKVNFNYDDFELIGQYGEGAKHVLTLTAQKVEEPRPKVFVYDMGQNMVGVPRIHIKNGQKGQVINMRFAEVLYPDLEEYKGNEGMVMMENIRAALAQDQYILKGGDEIIEPRFTFHGYRFIEITGIENALPVEAVEGLVISSVDELASEYTTSDPLVNKLWENITWSLRSNFLSIPTDCAQRNERMGWSGDISVFSKAATYLCDANMFLRKHMMAMRDLQPESGRFTDVAPVGGGFGGTLWGSAGIVVAWETYRQYGDKQLLEQHYPAMKKYIAFLETRVNDEGILNEGPLGDWLSPEGNKNDNTLFWMAYFAYDLDIMSQMAEALGKSQEAIAFKQRSEEIKETFNEVYVSSRTRRTVKSGVRTGFMGPPGESRGDNTTDKGELIDTQASYAIPLALDIFNTRNKPYAIRYLSETITRKNTDDLGVERPENSLMTGFIGTASINEALSQNSRDDLAYQLLVNKQYPSWLYSVVNGATTIWERLNSYTVENGFGGNNSMNSFNHYSFGAVAAWMYNYSLGIQRSPDETGFKHFVLKPTPDPTGQITHAEGYYNSMYGRIESKWAVEGNETSYDFTVPANTTANLYLKASSITQIKEASRSIREWDGLSRSGQYFVLPLGSGQYSFTIRD
ncbi:alpha-L-rhamnosidase [Jiulongibacter sediminis]|jgi:alpha-L-rhamnosidase|uniref:alpha-L-rhamnosidase n=1 Tax=Jiulongibacter sediminis TaxID=1605367 RepID=UPI0026F2E67E|nr:alpha-L-rhamnosidase [Jiulongibacter sediminis]